MRGPIDLFIDASQLNQASDGVIRGVLGAGKLAITQTTRDLEKDLEAATKAALPGRFWRAWTSGVGPSGNKIARSPSGWVRLNSSETDQSGRVTRTYGLLHFISQPGQIQGSRGQWLAIPLPAAGSRGARRNLTPAKWEEEHGVKLRLVKSQERGGRVGLLVADLGTTNARTGQFRRITRRRTAADDRRGYMRGEQSVPIFVLVRDVPFSNRLAIEPYVRAAEQKLIGRFNNAIGFAERMGSFRGTTPSGFVDREG